MSTVRFPGKEIQLGDQTFVVPPLTFKQIRALEDKIKSVGKVAVGEQNTVSQLTALGDVIHTALQRNYPDLAREELDDLLDLGNIVPAFQAVMNIAGFRPTIAGEGGTESPLAGMPSTPT